MARNKKDARDILEQIINNATEIFDYQYYHQLVDNRTIVLNAEIGDDFLERVYLPLKDFEDDDCTTPVTLILSTPGGSVTDSLFICDYLKHYKKKLNIVVCGCACSMGTVICAAASVNPNITRMSYPQSFFLIHDGYTALNGATEAKTAQDIMKFNEMVDERVSKIILDGTKIAKEEYDSKARKQWFLFAEEAKEKGLIDKIIGEDEEC